MFDNYEFKTVITFKEFMRIVDEYPKKYILPAGYKTIPDDYIGVVEDRYFRPIKFSIRASVSIKKILE